MDKDHHIHNYSAPMPPTPSFNTLDYSLDHNHHHHHLMQFRQGESSGEHSNGIADYIPQQQQQLPPAPPPSCFYNANSSSFDKLSFADVMQFADFGPKLALNQGKPCEEPGIDPVYFLKFPVLNDKMDEHNIMMMNHESGGCSDGGGGREEVETEAENNNDERFNNGEEEDAAMGGADQEDGRMKGEEETARISEDNNSVQIRFLGHGEDLVLNQKRNNNSTALMQENNKNMKRKRPRTVKTSEEVESQRMTHIAVERNRRKQMNEHLRVLRSLMPGSYVQRGDQASIIGGAIEFVRELEQLLQCLESQKRRRLLGEAQTRQVGDSNLGTQQQQPLQPPFYPPLASPSEQMKLVELETGLREETAESKSCFADVEVKLLGFDAMIKILSRRRPGQLIKTIAALEDLQLIILHTNITTIEQTVLYSFNVKVASESRFTADDIAGSVQQIFSFIHANTSI
ncbi:hypothetical protein HN51_070009 [Arachis hypogaea]|uniref:transcription factor FAMA n=1 Tax=Arachis ipaensis TaxID=130454 RepID=UPI0007AF7F4B|nr:transcription factor FAMA [Arachis ipaensis]XP_025655020.1 transcription factor FAMA isoform X2 [Arachis hypogaea]